MGMPTLIGAGVGAVGSAITGQSPIKGALLGGATGGLFGGSESLLGQTEFGKNLFSSAAGGYVPSTAVGANLPASAVIDPSGQFLGANLSRAGAGMGAQIAGEGAAAASIPNSLVNTPNFLGGMGSSTFGDRALNTISNAGSTVKDWAANNPGQAIGAGLQGYQAFNQTPPLNLPVAPTAPITQKPAPSFGLGQDEKLLTRLSPSYGGLQVYGR